MAMNLVQLCSCPQAACTHVCGTDSLSYSFLFAVRFYAYCFFYYFFIKPMNTRKGIV